MLNFYKKVCLLGFILTSSVAGAQSPDIPLFSDEEDIFQAEDHFQPLVQKAEKKSPTPSEQKKETATPAPSTPNLGLQAIPLDSLRFPFPDVSIDLTNKKEATENRPQKEPTPVRLGENLNSNTKIPPTNNIIHSQDARDFELDHFYLGMTPIEIGKIALENGYKIAKSKKELPLFLTTRYEQECRLEGFYLPADIRACIREKGLTDQTVFLKDMTLTKGKNESLYFEFTSPATGNQAWRITYLNKGDNSLNFNQVNTAKKISRRDAFINAVLNKFGNPDDAQNYIWGDPEDAFMQIAIYGTAYDARITLTDMALSDEDYFEAKDWLEENPDTGNFNF